MTTWFLIFFSFSTLKSGNIGLGRIRRFGTKFRIVSRASDRASSSVCSSFPDPSAGSKSDSSVVSGSSGSIWASALLNSYFFVNDGGEK
jgi:hypothetical protein